MCLLAFTCAPTPTPPPPRHSTSPELPVSLPGFRHPAQPQSQTCLLSTLLAQRPSLPRAQEASLDSHPTLHQHTCSSLPHSHLLNQACVLGPRETRVQQERCAVQAVTLQGSSRSSTSSTSALLPLPSPPCSISYTPTCLWDKNIFPHGDFQWPCCRLTGVPQPDSLGILWGPTHSTTRVPSHLLPCWPRAGGKAKLKKLNHLLELLANADSVAEMQPVILS